MSESQKSALVVLEEGSDTIVVRGGVKVHFNARGGLDVYGDVSVGLHPVASDVGAKDAPQIGDVMPAGHKHADWIYLGISETTNEPLYAAARDSGTFKWREAMEYAERKSARVPSGEELKQLYDAKDKGALKGTFNVSGSDPDGWYWSATDYRDNAFYAWDERFDDGHRDWHRKDNQSSLRLVRS